MVQVQCSSAKYMPPNTRWIMLGRKCHSGKETGHRLILAALVADLSAADEVLEPFDSSYLYHKFV